MVKSKRCKVFGCRIGTRFQHPWEKIHVYNFPKNEALRRLWASTIPNVNPDYVTQHMTICALHWPKDAPKSRNGKNGVPSVPPSIFPTLGVKSSKSKAPVSSEATQQSSDLPSNSCNTTQENSHVPPVRETTQETSQTERGSSHPPPTSETFQVRGNPQQTNRMATGPSTEAKSSLTGVHYPSTVWIIHPSTVSKNNYNAMTEEMSRELTQDIFHLELEGANLCQCYRKFLTKVCKWLPQEKSHVDLDGIYSQRVNSISHSLTDLLQQFKALLGMQHLTVEIENLPSVTNKTPPRAEYSQSRVNEADDSSKQRVEERSCAGSTNPSTQSEVCSEKDQPTQESPPTAEGTHPLMQDSPNDPKFTPTAEENSSILQGVEENLNEITDNLDTASVSSEDHIGMDDHDDVIEWMPLDTTNFKQDRFKFKCHICEKVYYHKANLAVHVKSHQEGFQFGCEVCGRKFLREVHLKSHKKTHEEKIHNHKCDLCEEMFSYKTELIKHRRTHPNRKRFSCDVCGVSFLCKFSLRRHKLLHTTEFPYTCNECGQGFVSTFTLARHKMMLHSARAYRCDLCNKKFISVNGVSRHLIYHNGLKPHACDVCGKSYLNKRGLDLHQITHTGAYPYICDICGKGFKSMYNCQNHYSMHKEEKSFVCDVCGKAFGCEAYLNCHVKGHKKGKPYECTVCQRRFQIRKDLQRHGTIHSCEKPYACDECDRKFGLDRYLIRHKEACHRKKKNYFCEVCNKGFYANSSLKVHYKSHAVPGPYICDVCGREFINYYKLNMHKNAARFKNPRENALHKKSRESKLELDAKFSVQGDVGQNENGKDTNPSQEDDIFAELGSQNIKLQLIID